MMNNAGGQSASAEGGQTCRRHLVQMANISKLDVQNTTYLFYQSNSHNTKNKILSTSVHVARDTGHTKCGGGSIGGQ